MQSENQPKGAGSGEPASPATGRECWVEFTRRGEVINAYVKKPSDSWRNPGCDLVRMVEPPPSSPAREDVEPSGTASLRGAARLEPEDLTAARMLAAQGWCHPSTAHKVMDGELADAIAHVFAPFIGLLREGFEHVVWCSGSADFGPGGQAREGWMKGPVKWLEKVNKAIPASRSDAPEAKPEGPSPSSPPSPASQGAETPHAQILRAEMEFQRDRASAAEAKVETLEAALQAKDAYIHRLEKWDEHQANKLCTADAALRAAERAPEAPALANVLKKACAVVYDWREESRDEAKFAKLLEALEDACVAALPDGTPVEATGDAKRVEEALPILEVLHGIGAIKSYGEGRRLIGQRAVFVDGNEIVAHDARIYPDDLEIRVGKRTYQVPHVAEIRKAESSPPLPNGEGSRSFLPTSDEANRVVDRLLSEHHKAAAPAAPWDPKSPGIVASTADTVLDMAAAPPAGVGAVQAALDAWDKWQGCDTLDEAEMARLHGDVVDKMNALRAAPTAGGADLEALTDCLENGLDDYWSDHNKGTIERAKNSVARLRSPGGSAHG